MGQNNEVLQQQIEELRNKLDNVTNPLPISIIEGEPDKDGIYSNGTQLVICLNGQIKKIDFKE